MLEELVIKDFALIDSVSLEFSRGFTVLTGETGAGKSILIGALSFLLGGKSDSDSIRAGSQEASVAGVFSLSPQDSLARSWLCEHGIEPEDNRVRLRRVTRLNGKNSAWIESVPAAKAELAEFASLLVDIHGQRDHESLLRVGEHRKALDEFAGIAGDVARFTSDYSALTEKRAELDALNAADATREEKIERLTYAVEEITQARLSPHEEEELTMEETRLNQFEKLYSSVDEALSIDILSPLKKINSLISHAADLDNALAETAKRCDSAFYEMSDIADELRAYSRDLVFDPERLNQIEERLTQIFKLKKKYAGKGASGGVQGTIGDVLAFAESAQKELDTLADSDAARAALQKTIADMERSLYANAKSLSQKRKAAALEMSAHIQKALAALGMKESRFTASITEKAPAGDGGGNAEFTHICGPYGIDNVEFLLSANPGVPEKPLAKIASGGELSRVMLALKTVFADGDTIGTLVFDEIDTGIGGEVSVAVGAHMKQLARSKQILCITHLASIAVYADTQMKIEKITAQNRTKTSVGEVMGEQRVAEIGRMLSGDAASAQSLDHARAMLQKFGEL
ncbi:MAG: DNA repair protein RecN [Treponemataceae bacterium]|nr:MAG: DNA repair protein RecN [Treponemataceae bacterium]